MINDSNDGFILDKQEKCGVFAIFDNDGHDCARLAYYALYALQHRGQESCGIVVNIRGFSYHKDMGLVPEVLMIIF